MSFWEMLGRTEREAFTAVAHAITFESRARVFSEGEPSGFALIIQDGWVKVAGGTSEGGETALALRRTGDLVGESASADRPRTATVVAVGPVRALIVTAHHFSAIVGRHRKAAQALRRTDQDRRIESDRKRMDVREANSDARRAGLLLEIAEGAHECPDGVVLGPPLTQPELAQLICASTASVERALRSWRRREYVSTGYRGRVLHDLAELRRIARRPVPPRDGG